MALNSRVVGFVGCLLLGMFAVPSLEAQTAETSGQGYFFVAPGRFTGFFGSSNTLHMGAGGELLLGTAAGISGELGYLGSIRALGEGIGVLSINGSYYIPTHREAQKVKPFLTVGYTLMFRDEHIHIWNAGLGLHFWAGKRMGLRAEFRDHVRPEHRGTVHYWGVRGGIVFR